MIAAEVLDASLTAGASAEMIVAAVKAAARETELRRAERRARDAERQRRSRRSQRDRDVSRPVTRTPRDQADAPPDDYISNPPPPQSSDENRSPDLPALPDRVVAAWSDGPGKAGAMACRGFNPKRRSALAARLREHGEIAVFEAIGNLAGSPFHCGANDRGWRASLGWLLTSAENFQKMLELGPPPEAAAPTMTPAERAASLERSAACLDQIGRADDAAAMRRSAATIRAGLPANATPQTGGD